MRSLRETMQVLYRRAEPTMTVDDLDKVAGATYFAHSHADKMATVCEGIACLVDADDGARTGSFQDRESLFDLMCAVTNSFDEIAALTQLGDDATARKADLLSRCQPAAERPQQLEAQPPAASSEDGDVWFAVHYGIVRFVRMTEMCRAIQNADTLEQAQALAEFGEETCAMASDYLWAHEQRNPAKRLNVAA